MQKIAAISLLTLLACACTSLRKKEVEFFILQLNDVYEIAPLEGGKVGGLARVATVLDSLKDLNPNTISLLAGDFISPSLIGMLNHNGEEIAGKQMIETLNAIGLDYVTFGNHEFDVKEPEVQARIDESEFTWIASNTLHKVDGISRPWTRKGKALQNFEIEVFTNTLGDTVKVGLMGITGDFNQKEYVHYLNDYVNVGKQLLQDYREEYDVSVAITHLEIAQDTVFAGALQEIPLILGGHDHVHMHVPVGESVVTKADANAKTIYIHRCIYDVSSQTLNVESTLMPINDQIVAHPKVDKEVKRWTQIAEQSMKDMGYDPQDVIYRANAPLDGREKSIRYEPTNLGALIAQSLYASRNKLDFAIFNSGSVRLDDQLMGDITQTDVLRTLPFGGPLVITQMKGDQVRQMLNIGLYQNRGIGGYFQTYKIGLQEHTFTINDEPLDNEYIYTFIAPKFLMDGKESNLGFLGRFKYDEPEQFAGGVRNDIRDVFIDYLSQQ